MTGSPGERSRALAGLEERARDVLDPVVYRYVSQGARWGTSAREAVAAWDSLRLVPRVFGDTRGTSARSGLLGTPCAAPLGVAPSTLQRAAHPEGELAMARGCARAGVPMVLSSNASIEIGALAETGVDWWLQAYLPQDRDLAIPLIEAAASAGASAVVLTADTPVVAEKYDDGAVWRQVPSSWVRVNLGRAADAPKARDLGPADIAWLRELSGLPVVVKGIADPRDAVAAVEGGAAAVWVSNHGGRQLDHAVATADCLGEVAAAVDGAAEVYADGGIRTGITVLKALALGADACFLGRLPLYALAAGGEAGVTELFETLTLELTEALRLAGCSSPADARHVRVRPPNRL